MHLCYLHARLCGADADLRSSADSAVISQTGGRLAGGTDCTGTDLPDRALGTDHAVEEEHTEAKTNLTRTKTAPYFSNLLAS